MIGRLLEVYVRERIEEERFIDTVNRLGIDPFKSHVYATPIEEVADAAGETTYA